MSLLNQNYRDMEGQMRTFTHVDHDIKTSINTTILGDEDLEEKLKADRVLIQNKILSLPASACPSVFDDFKVREGNTIEWNQTMIKDSSIPWVQLYNIYTLTSNRLESVGYGQYGSTSAVGYGI